MGSDGPILMQRFVMMTVMGKYSGGADGCDDAGDDRA